MAADEASEDVAPSSPPLLSHDANDNADNADHSLSNASSPLTEVEDKDGEPDEMDLDVDGPVHNSSSLSNVNLDDDDENDNENGSRAARSRSGSDNEDESALSEVEPDINDSEAETERLYDTPTKAKNIKDGADAESSPESVTMGLSPTKRLAAQAAQSRDRTFQASPSKLKQQLHADSDEEEDAEEDDDEDDALSEAEDEENNEADGEEEAAADDREATRSSRRRSLAAKEQAKKLGQSPSVGSKTKDETNGDKEDTPVPTPALLRTQRSSNSNSDTRKRKRSPTTDPSESDQPLRKRIGSGARDAPSIAEDVDGEKVSSKRLNGATDDDAAETGADEKAEADNSAEGTNSDTFRARRSKRGSARKTRSNSDGDDNEDQNENDDAEDGDMATAEEDAAGQGDDEPIDGDVDEEAEAAHRNEEELERKKAALENLHAIEKQFASFRDKLYQERLDQLNQEEEMLLGDNPTHPEYLAMMQCVNERRDEKIRVIDVEYNFNLQTLKRWAVGRRSHIHGQYFQSIRESRELVLEELGRQWYQIQQQRRRHANTIPDYGLQFPSAKTQRVKDAITYNKEVSILSGIAKYEGFPAAPKINGASSSQVDDDLEAIARGRQSVPSVHAVQPHAHAHPHLHAAHGHGHGHSHSPYPELAGSTLVNSASTVTNGNGNGAATATNGNGGPVSFHSLGAAGQQFLADTPWANPHHPAHAHHVQLQQQQRQQGSPAAKSTASASASGQPATPQQPRKPLPQQAAASHGTSKSGSSGASHVPYSKSGQPAPKTAPPPPMPIKRDVATVSF